MTAFKKISMTIAGMLMGFTAQITAADCCSPVCESTYCCAGENSFGLRGELLYWRPELCGLEGAFGTTVISTSVSPNAITTTTVTESDEEPKSKWSAGFRIGAGARVNCFDVDLDWTHFDGHADFHKGEQSGKWKIRYDAVDLIFGKYFHVTPCIALKPFIGVRGLNIHQKLNSHLRTLFTSIIGNNTVITDKHDTEDFRAAGPELGFIANWKVGCDFSLYGSFAVVSYYGEVKAHNCDTDTFTSTVSACHGKKHRCFNNIGTDLALGVRWDRSIAMGCGCDCSCVDFTLRLGVEQHRIYDFSDLGSDGTLSLDGGVFAIGVNYRY